MLFAMPTTPNFTKSDEQVFTIDENPLLSFIVSNSSISIKTPSYFECRSFFKRFNTSLKFCIRLSEVSSDDIFSVVFPPDKPPTPGRFKFPLPSNISFISSTFLFPVFVSENKDSFSSSGNSILSIKSTVSLTNTSQLMYCTLYLNPPSGIILFMPIIFGRVSSPSAIFLICLAIEVFPTPLNPCTTIKPPSFSKAITPSSISFLLPANISGFLISFAGEKAPFTSPMLTSSTFIFLLFYFT